MCACMQSGLQGPRSPPSHTPSMRLLVLFPLAHTQIEKLPREKVEEELAALGVPAATADGG